MDTRIIRMEGHTTSTAHRLMHYNGVCNNVHGHNIEWNVKATVEVPEDDTNMIVDFKAVKDVVDKYDHAILLNKHDPLVNAPSGVRDLLGNVHTFDGDPTCELIAQVVADEIVALDGVISVHVECGETNKYSLEAYAYSE